MEYLELHEDKGHVTNSQSPWLQFHLGQSHGYFGTSHKLNVKKDTSDVLGSRPTLQKTMSNLEPRSLSGTSSSLSGASTSSKQRLKIHGKSLSSEQNVSFENLWWIARNEKIGGAVPGMKPWDETKGLGRKAPPTVFLPAVGPTKQNTRAEGGRTRSADNRLLGKTRANHGFNNLKKPVHNNFLEFKQNDSDKIARLGELTRMGSSLGCMTRLRLGASPENGDNDNSATHFTPMKLKHFGIRKSQSPAPATTDFDRNVSSEPQGRPQTAPDKLQRLPEVQNGKDKSEQSYPPLVNGQNKDICVYPERHVLPEVNTRTTDDPPLGQGSSGDGDDSSWPHHASSKNDSTLPSNEEEDLRCLPSQQAGGREVDTDIDKESKGNNSNVNNKHTHIPPNKARAADNKLSKANLSISEFFCITVDPNSFSNSGICIYPGSPEEEGEFTSVQDDLDRKRRVRFSITHEIHEYQPWEPIDNIEDSEDVQQQSVQPSTSVAPSIGDPDGNLVRSDNIPNLSVGL